MTRTLKMIILYVREHFLILLNTKMIIRFLNIYKQNKDRTLPLCLRATYFYCDDLFSSEKFTNTQLFNLIAKFITLT